MSAVGILHQAETKGGWRITRTGPLFDSGWLNATLFLNRREAVLNEFCDYLKAESWESSSWVNVRKKMDAICDNCAQRP
jgi:hypothetical protein